MLIVFISVVLMSYSTFAYNDNSYIRLDKKSIEFSEINKFIEEKMKESKIPGLSLAIIDNSKVIFCKGYGIRTANSQEFVNENTIFEAASLGKPVFAYTVMRLAQDKLIDLDKPLYQYFDYKDLASDTHSRKITARMLLSHTSGLPNWRGQDGLKLLFEPGEKFSYSGEGYIYLQKVVEEICGKPVNQIVKERVFEPLQMNRSSYVWETDFDDNYAIGHDEKGNPQVKFKPNSAGVAGTLHTTASDYAKFLIDISKQQGIQGNIVNDMLKPQVKLIDTNGERGVYWGLGFGLQNNKENIALWHWGNNVYFNNYTILYEERNIGVVYFTNSSNGLNIAKDVIPYITGDNDQVSLDWLLGKSNINQTSYLVIAIVLIFIFLLAVVILIRKKLLLRNKIQ